MLLDKVNHVLGCRRPQWDRFNPLGEIIYCHYYELMTIAGWWMNLSDYVDPPTSKWPWLDYMIHN